MSTLLASFGWLVLVLLIKAALFVVGHWIRNKRSRKGAAKADAKYKILQRGIGNVPSSQKVVITGGCGFLGRHLLELLTELYADRLDIWVFDRYAKPNPSYPRVTYVSGDLLVAHHVNTVLAGAAAVIHTAGIMQDALTDLDFMAAVNVEGTQIVVEACLELEVKVLIYTSSISVLWPKSPVAMPRQYESQTTLPPEEQLWEYATTKSRAEQLVLGANGHIVRTLVMRPGGLYGHGDVHIVDQAHRYSPSVGKDNWVRPPLVWVRDVTRAHVMALVKLLWPGDQAAWQLCAAPWGQAGAPPPGADEPPGAAITGVTAASTPAQAAKQRHAGKASQADSGGAASSKPSDDASAAQPLLPGGDAGSAAAPPPLPPVMHGNPSNAAGLLAGRVCHLVHDPDVGLPTYRTMCGGPDPESPDPSVNCWGCRTQPTIPIWFAMMLAIINEACAKWLGMCPITPDLNVRVLKTATRDAEFDITNSKHVLGWQPTPWRQAVAAIRAERAADMQASLTQRSSNAAAKAGAASKKTQ